MPRIDPYKYEYDYEAEPSTAGAMIFVGVITAIIVASLVWASYNPQLGTNPPAPITQPATPSPTAR